MAFGFQDGAIEILTSKPNYKEGEKVAGKVVINLNSAKSARGVVLRLFAHEGAPEPGSNKTRDLFSKTVRLDSEKRYLEGQHEYPFEIELPHWDDLPNGAPFPFEWFIEAKLDIPLSMDIATIEKIFIK